MDEEQAEYQPKIGLVEALFIGLAVLVLDVIDLIPIAGDITDGPSLLVNYYLYSKGVNGIWFIIGEVLDLIPVVQEFPSRSIAWVVVVYLDHHPSKIIQTAEKAGELAEGGESGGEVGAATETGEGAAAGVKQEVEGTVEGEGVAAHAEGEVGTTTESETTGREKRGEGGRTETEKRGGEPEGGEPEEEEEEHLEDEERAAREEQIAKDMRSGAEITPEEELEEETLNPKELRFKEAKGKYESAGAKGESKEEEDENLSKAA
jgi:hypothetical protein